MKKSCLLAFLLSLLFSSGVMAESRLIALYGVGSSSCGALTQAWEETPPNLGVQHGGFVFYSESKLYAEWIAGFISAKNISAGSIGNVASGLDIEGITQWIRKYCENNPTHVVSGAASQFIKFMVKSRPKEAFHPTH